MATLNFILEYIFLSVESVESFVILWLIQRARIAFLSVWLDYSVLKFENL